MIKAVICTRCEYKYHQDLPSLLAITVHPCPLCGGAARMMMGPGQAAQTGLAAVGFVAPKFPWPEVGSPVVPSLLRVSHSDLAAFHDRAVFYGFTCVGFHGCGSVYAENILRGIRAVSTTEARGPGFMVGSLYGGIPASWAAQAKGGGTATILRIYVRDWRYKRFARDFDWGKMDPKDDVAEEGLEMVLRNHILADVCALPSAGPTDQKLVHSSIWADCPTHNFRAEEMDKARDLARRLGLTLEALDNMIANDQEGLAKLADSKGVSLE